MKTNFKYFLFFAFIATLTFAHSNAVKRQDSPEMSADEFRTAVEFLTSSQFKYEWIEAQNRPEFADLKDYLNTYKHLPELQGLRSFIENLDTNNIPDKTSVQKRETDFDSPYDETIVLNPSAEFVYASLPTDTQEPLNAGKPVWLI